MFTSRRFNPPSAKDGGAKDIRELAAAVADYLLSLESPNALTINQATLDASTNGITLPTGTCDLGISFGGASTGITYSKRQCSYTVAGDRVMGTAYIVLTSKGSATGAAKITGLPYTAANDDNAYAPVSVNLAVISYAGMVQAVILKNTTTVSLQDISEAGTAADLDDTNFANNSEIMVAFNYRKA